MLELRPSLKALKGLAIPSVSITIFLLFVIADLDLVWSIISGSTYLSYVVRLVMLGVEIYLFRYFYLIELKAVEKEKQVEKDKEFIDSLNPTSDKNKIKTLGDNIIVDCVGNYISDLNNSYNNRVSIEYIEDSNKNRWFKFKSVK